MSVPNSHKISKLELYDDSDSESVYSMDGYDPNYLPKPQYEAFPPYTEKRVYKREPRGPNIMNYYTLYEATPHDEWYCEFPNCNQSFLPYIIWGSRHHCRACGMTVCADHGTRSITLSTQIVPKFVGELTEVSTPILATSMDPSLLPPAVTLKYACLICCSRALPAKDRKDEETETAGSGVPLRRSERATKDVQRLLTTLSEVRGELEARVTDVCTLSGEMSQYAATTATMQRVIENLEQQLKIAQSEGHLSKTGKQRLRQLKRELQTLQGQSTAGKAAESGWKSGKASADDTSSEGDSCASSRSHSISLDGVNDAGHPPPPLQYHPHHELGTAVQEEAGPVRMAPVEEPAAAEDEFAPLGPEVAADALEQSPAAEETERMAAESPAVLNASSIIAASPSSLVYTKFATIELPRGPADAPEEPAPLERDAAADATLQRVAEAQEPPAASESERTSPSGQVDTTPATIDQQVLGSTEVEHTTTSTPLRDVTWSAVGSPMSDASASRPEDWHNRSRSAEFSYGDVYARSVKFTSPDADEVDDDVYSQPGNAAVARRAHQHEVSPMVQFPTLGTPADAVSTASTLQMRSMSAYVDYQDVYEESDDGEQVLDFDTVAVPLNLGFPEDQVRASDEELDVGVGEAYSAHSSVFNMLERGSSGLSSTDPNVEEPSLSVHLRTSRDTNDTSETTESFDDLTYSTKNTPVKPASAVQNAAQTAATTARGGTTSAGTGVGIGGGNPLRLKRKSV